MLIILFLVSHFCLFRVKLPVSFLLHVKYTLSYLLACDSVTTMLQTTLQIGATQFYYGL